MTLASVMADLWRTKQRINAEAGYDIDKLLARVKRRSKQVGSSAVKVNLRSNSSVYSNPT